MDHTIFNIELAGLAIVMLGWTVMFALATVRT